MFSQEEMLMLIIVSLILLFILYLYNRKTFNNIEKKIIKKNNVELFDNLRFLAINDINNNPVEFIKLICNGDSFSFDNISSLLKYNGINKNPEEILNINKNNLDKFVYNKTDKTAPYIFYPFIIGYGLLSNSETNNVNIIKNNLINSQLKLISLERLYKNNINSGDVNLQFEINNDYLTSDKINIYLRTPNNMNVPIENAIKHDSLNLPDSPDSTPSLLYYYQIPQNNLTMNDYAINLKNNIKLYNELIIISRLLCDLLFVKKLLILDANNYDITIPTNITRNIGIFLLKLDTLEKEIGQTEYNIKTLESVEMSSLIRVFSLHLKYALDMDIQV